MNCFKNSYPYSMYIITQKVCELQHTIQHRAFQEPKAQYVTFLLMSGDPVSLNARQRKVNYFQRTSSITFHFTSKVIMYNCFTNCFKYELLIKSINILSTSESHNKRYRLFPCSIYESIKTLDRSHLSIWNATPSFFHSYFCHDILNYSLDWIQCYPWSVSKRWNKQTNNCIKMFPMEAFS